MSIDAWNAIADAAVSAEDPQLAGKLTDALMHLGLGTTERDDLDRALAGREDTAGQLLRRLVAGADVASPGPSSESPAFETAAMDRALDFAEQMRTDPGLAGDIGDQAQLAVLAALPPPEAGALVVDLVTRGMAAADEEDRRRALLAAVAVSRSAPMTRLPVPELVAASSGATPDVLAQLGTILGRAPRTRVLKGLASALHASPDPAIPGLIESIQWAADTPPPPSQPPSDWTGDDTPAPDPVWRGGHEAGREDWVGSEPPMPTTSAPPPEMSAPPPQASAPPPAPTAPGAPQPPETSGAEPVGTEPAPSGSTTPGSGGAGGARTAYPLIKIDTGTERPDVVVVEQPFAATVGLGARPMRTLVSAGALTAVGPELEVVVVYDPVSLTVDGPQRYPLAITADDPFPTVPLTVTANYLEDPAPTRRIGAQYLLSGQVVGMAWLSFTVVDEAGQVPGAPAPPSGERELLDLAPVLGDTAPDLVLAVFASDTAQDRWIWTAYATDPALPVPDAPNAATLDGDVAAFALATRRAIQFSGDRVQDYFTLTGRARRIGASMPAVVHRTLTALLTQEGRTTAPSVLLLTEELVIPWELASLQPRPTTSWGGESEFLGAHVAVGRWPLSEHRPRPVPRSSVEVREAAVVTGDYTGVPGWGVLKHATEEADEVAALFTPPAARVDAELLAVIDLLRGTPPANLVHVALHGQFDHQGEDEGIVLVQRSENGAKAQFLTPVQVENGHLAAGPFVFLNACQVGSDQRVLGSYGGFASTLLRIGAGGVVAPLWNIDDDIAAVVARDLYAATLGGASASASDSGNGDNGNGGTGTAPVSVAEAMRRIRAAYTEASVRAGEAGASATLVAFQVFGHPRLQLHHGTRPTT